MEDSQGTVSAGELTNVQTRKSARHVPSRRSPTWAHSHSQPRQNSPAPLTSSTSPGPQLRESRTIEAKRERSSSWGERKISHQPHSHFLLVGCPPCCKQKQYKDKSFTLKASFRFSYYKGQSVLIVQLNMCFIVRGNQRIVYSGGWQLPTASVLGMGWGLLWAVFALQDWL